MTTIRTRRTLLKKGGGHLCVYINGHLLGRERGIFWALALVCSVPFIAVADEHGNVRIAAQAANKLEATIFSYDGQDFVRVKTTLLTADGKSALNTKPEHDNPAYKALIHVF
jgi:hypothetical protein